MRGDSLRRAAEIFGPPLYIALARAPAVGARGRRETRKKARAKGLKRKTPKTPVRGSVAQPRGARGALFEIDKSSKDAKA